MTCPRVLIVALGRINAADTSNNGLLLRNLFHGWPRESLAQVYSSGDNGDAGFFGHYYRLGPQDRRLGGVFYRMKAGEEAVVQAETCTEPASGQTPAKLSRLKAMLRRVAIDTGAYELIFRPRLSQEMMAWVKEFKPDIIFAQGYNLTFSWLPVMLKRETGARLALLTSDDWPTYLYSGQLGEPKLLSCLLRPAVNAATRQLMDAMDVPFAFGHAMADEYSARYGKEFIVLSHSDDRTRFDNAVPIRVHEPPVLTIAAIGNFNAYRWPLLQDVDEACRLLEAQGLNVRIAVFSCGIDPEGERELAMCSHVDLLPDPGNEQLPAYLKGADILLLAEGFDEGFVDAIRLSVSSKSHLFMFSRRPILVYAHVETGVARYASSHHWGQVVSERSVMGLSKAIKMILTDTETAERLVSSADKVAEVFHLREASQACLRNAMIPA